jgi:hypothetical protein
MTYPPRWTPPEATYLDQLAGDVPFPELVARYQRQAERQGWPSRSASAIQQRLVRTRQSGRARMGACLTTGGIADILGCQKSRVHAWLKRPKVVAVLKPRRVGGFYYIERSDLRRLAQKMPQVLGGFGADALFLLLEKRELAEEVARQCPGYWGDKRIRCIETGRIWPSCSAAADALHVDYTTISLAIKQRRPVTVLGLTFERCRQPHHNAA